jgi:hypothetical protein
MNFNYYPLRVDEFVAETSTEDFKPGSLISTYLRLCYYKTWADRIASDIPYDTQSMLSPETAVEVCTFFGANSHHWNKCDVKAIPKRWIPNILKTAKNWATIIQEKRREASVNRVQMPGGDPAAAWKESSQRAIWESYYVTIIGEAKCKAPKTSRSVKNVGQQLDGNPKPSRKQRLNAFQSPNDGQNTLPNVYESRALASAATGGAPSTAAPQAVVPSSVSAENNGNSRSLITDMINAGASSAFQAEIEDAKNEATKQAQQLALLVETGTATVNLLTRLVTLMEESRTKN